MPLDGNTTEMEVEKDKKPKKGIPNLKPMSTKPKLLDEDFLDPATHTFSEFKERGAIHEYLMSIWPEEGQVPAHILEMGQRLAAREDCEFSMLQVCNALSDLAQDGKITVKEVITTHDQFSLYGIWEVNDET